jgi:hypothetical protein
MTELFFALTAEQNLNETFQKAKKPNVSELLF